MLHILTRSAVEAPSSGITTVGEEMREEVDARELRVGTEDLREIREAVDVRVETRPGILS